MDFGCTGYAIHSKGLGDSSKRVFRRILLPLTKGFQRSLKRSTAVYRDLVGRGLPRGRELNERAPEEKNPSAHYPRCRLHDPFRCRTFVLQRPPTKSPHRGSLAEWGDLRAGRMLLTFGGIERPRPRKPLQLPPFPSVEEQLTQAGCAGPTIVLKAPAPPSIGVNPWAKRLRSKDRRLEEECH